MTDLSHDRCKCGGLAVLYESSEGPRYICGSCRNSIGYGPEPEKKHKKPIMNASIYGANWCIPESVIAVLQGTNLDKEAREFYQRSIIRYNNGQFSRYRTREELWELALEYVEIR
jgi:hypothetical protein